MRGPASWRSWLAWAAAWGLLGILAWVLAAPLAALLARAVDDAGTLADIWPPLRNGFGHRFGNMIKIAAGTTGLTLVLGVALGAVLANERPLPGRRLFYFLAFLPFWIPTYVVSIVAIEALGRNGALARALKSAGLIAEFPSFVYSVTGVVIVMTFSLLPFVVLPVAMALRSQDRELLDAARLEAGEWGIWLSLRLPLAAPVMFTSALLVFFLAAVEFAAPEQLQVPTGIVEVFMEFQSSFSALRAVGAALPVVALCGALAWALGRRVPLGEGEGRMAAFDARESAGPKRQSRNWAGVALCVAGLALPTGALMVFLAARAGAWVNYRNAFATSGEELGVSVVWSGAAALAAVALAVTLAVRAYSWPRRRVRLIVILMAIMLGIPGVLFGFGLVVLYNRPELPMLRAILISPAILLMAHLPRALPVAIIIALPLVRGLDQALWDAARLEGAERGWRGWRTLWLPHAGGPLLVLTGLLFVLNLQDLGAPLMVQPPGATPFIVRIFSLIHFGFDQYVAALCLILAGICLGAAGVVWAFMALGKRTPAEESGGGGARSM